MGAELEKAAETVVVPLSLLTKVAEQQEAVSGLKADLEKKAEQDRQVKELAPLAVDEMINAGVLDPEKRASALENAGDQVKVMGTVIKLAQHITQLRAGQTKKAADKNAPPPSLGKGGDGQSQQSVKVASARDTTINSDFLRAFGL